LRILPKGGERSNRYLKFFAEKGLKELFPQAFSETRYALLKEAGERVPPKRAASSGS